MLISHKCVSAYLYGMLQIRNIAMRDSMAVYGVVGWCDGTG